MASMESGFEGFESFNSRSACLRPVSSSMGGHDRERGGLSLTSETPMGLHTPPSLPQEAGYGLD